MNNKMKTVCQDCKKEIEYTEGDLYERVVNGYTIYPKLFKWSDDKYLCLMCYKIRQEFAYSYSNFDLNPGQ